MFTVSFYSYKGGVGRTATLLNTAWFMAMRGRRVALIDFDLEAPGLEASYLSNRDDQDGRHDVIPKGLFRLIKEYVDDTTDDPAEAFDNAWRRVDPLIEGLGPDHRIALLPAGHKNENYVAFVQQFSWNDFYKKSRGVDFMLNLTDKLAHLGYEYLFIDARTGLTDVAFISTVQLPNLVVLITNLTKQSIDGIRDRIENIDGYNKQCREEGGCPTRRPEFIYLPIEVILAASPLPRGEWDLRKQRLEKAEMDLTKSSQDDGSIPRRIDIEIDYLDMLAIGESKQIIFREMDSRNPERNQFLSNASLPYQKLGEEISRRNPESPENLIKDGTSLLEVGLWRMAKAHYDEASERIQKHARLVDHCAASAEDSYNTNQLNTNPTYQAARLGWLLADLQALYPDRVQKALSDLWEQSTETTDISIQRARVWLGLSFTYILDNEFEKSAHAADQSSEILDVLVKANPSDRLLHDLRALSLLRSGYARMLDYQWERAREDLFHSYEIYDSLGARPMLFALTSSQLTQVALALCEPSSIPNAQNAIEQIRYLLSDDTSSRQEFPLLAQSSGILSQHVKGDINFTDGILKYEMGDGPEAIELLHQAMAFYSDDNDSVGQLDVLVPALGLGLMDFGNGTICGKDRTEWMSLAKNLRVPISAQRIELACVALVIAKWDNNDIEELRRRLDLLGRGNPEIKDPALPVLVSLEDLRFRLLKNDMSSHISKLEEIIAYTKEEINNSLAHGHDIRPLVDHTLLLIEGAVALASDDGQESNWAQNAKKRAYELDSWGYHLKAAQIRLLLALIDPDDSLPDLARMIRPGGTIKEAATWPWMLPLAFVFRSERPKLVAHCKMLKERCLDLGGLVDKIFRWHSPDVS